MTDSVTINDLGNTRNMAQRLGAVTGRFTDLAALLEQYRAMGQQLGTRAGGTVKALDDQGQTGAFVGQVDNLKSQCADVLAPRLGEWSQIVTKAVDEHAATTDEGIRRL